MRIVNIYWYMLTALFCCVGLAGAVLIDDEFYAYTLTSVAFLGLPALALTAVLVHVQASIWTHSLLLRTFLIGTLLTGFTPGVITLLNAVTASGKSVTQRVQYGHLSFLDEKQEGGLGYLYKLRF